MKTVTFTCDICEKGFDFQRSASMFSGQTLKMNPSTGQLGNMVFEGHYCGDCTNKILIAIEQLKKENGNNTIK